MDASPHIHLQKYPLSQYWSIVRAFSISDFRLKYHNSILGYLWSMLNPLALFGVYHFVFSYLFIVEVPKFTLYLLSGIVFWNFFADATFSAMNALDAKGELTKKISFPRSILVVASTSTALFSFAINVGLLVFIVVVTDHSSVLQILFIIPCALMVMLTVGMSFFLAALYIHFRDMLQIWSVCLSVGFWLTPVVYNALTAPAPLQTVALFNPVGRILVLARAYLIFDNTPSLPFIISTALVTLLLYYMGWWFFKRYEEKIPEYF